MRIGIFLPNWVGDIVMATPALRSLHTHLSDRATLIGITRSNVSEVLAGTEWLDQTITYDRKTLLGRVKLTRELRRASLDVVLLLTNSLSTATLAWASGAKRRVGFAMHHRSWLLTDRLQLAEKGRAAQPRSAIDHYLDIASTLGCHVDSKQVQLSTTPRDEAAADMLWNKFGWLASEPVVVLNTGGAYGAAKSWPDEHFAQLARHVADEHGVSVLVICGPTERDAAESICQQAGHDRIRSLANEQLSLGLSKACVRRSRLMITTDSGPRHFAAAFGVPVATIFGPTDPRWSDNYHPQSIDLRRDVDCGPCSQRVCPHEHHRCMRDLTANDVMAEARHFFDAAVQYRAA